MRLFVPLLLLLMACPDGRTGPILSPAPGSVITSPVIPVVAVMPDRAQNAPMNLYLDGVDVTDPLALNRKAMGHLGSQRHLLAQLKLVDVPAGEHTLEVVTGRFPSRTRASSTFTLAPPEAQVDVALYDASGVLTPGRVYVLDRHGPVELASVGAAVDHKGRDLDQAAVLCVEGTGVAWLEPGDYTLVGWRGLRSSVDVQQVTLRAGRNTVDFTSKRVIQTPGMVSTDLHVHTGRSNDAWIPDAQRFDALNTVGLDLYVVTDHDHITDGPKAAHAAHPHPPVQAVTGVELDVWLSGEADSVAIAHFNMFPIEPLGRLPTDAGETVTEVLSGYLGPKGPQYAEETDGHGILQLNHPRGIHFLPHLQPQVAWPLFDQLGFSHYDAPGDAANAWMTETHDGVGVLDFQVLEVVNRFSIPLYSEVRRDWFYLLDHGIYRTASGNSDTHGTTVELAGMTVTLVEAERDGDGVNLSDWVASLETGRATVSTGVFVSIDVLGAGPGDTLDHSGPTTVEVRVQAASWVPVEEVRLIERSREVWRIDVQPGDRHPDGHLDKRWTVSLDFGHEDTWVVGEAGFPIGRVPSDDVLGLYADIAPGYVPLGFTNAIRINADGDDAWTPQPR